MRYLSSLTHPACPGDQLADFGVGRLREVFVREADRVERYRSRRADDLVGFLLEFFADLLRRGRYSDDDACGAALAQGTNRRAHRRPSRETVVDDDHGLALDVTDHRFSAACELASLQ